jgi:hypothetical protein
MNGPGACDETVLGHRDLSIHARESNGPSSSPMKTLGELIADKLERADTAGRAALLGIPLENIVRWIANGHPAIRRLEQWRQIISGAQESPEGFAGLLLRLRDPGEAAARLRDFSPFAGMLTREERLQSESACAYHF